MPHKLKSLEFRCDGRQPPVTIDADLRRELKLGVTKARLQRAVGSLLEHDSVARAWVIESRNGHVVLGIQEAPEIRNVRLINYTGIADDDVLQPVSWRRGDRFSKKFAKASIAGIASVFLARGLSRPSIEINSDQVSEGLVELTIVAGSNPDAASRRRKPAAIERTSFRRAKTGKPASAASRGDDAAPVSAETGDHPGEGSEGAAVVDRPGREAGGSGQHSPIAGPGASASPRAATVPEAVPDVQAEIAVLASSWTGRPTVAERMRAFRVIVPRAMSEVDALIRAVEAERFNDPETESALELLRGLYRDLGDLISAVEERTEGPVLKRIARKNVKFVTALKTGAKVGVVAPALTIGVSHLLSALANVPVDSTMVSTVFATMVAIQQKP